MMMWAGGVAAETWEWVDSQGTVSFTDDLQNIPRESRRSARKIAVESSPAPQPASPAAPVPTEGGAADQRSAVPDTSAAPLPSGVAGQPPSEGGTVRAAYGNRTAAQWQEAFCSLNGEIRGVDGQLKEKQRLLKEPGTLSRSDYLKLEDEIRRLSSSLTALLATWDVLNREATAAQVPLELRQ